MGKKCDDGGGSCAVACYGRVAKSTLLSVVILRAAVLGPAGARAQQPRVLAILVMWTCLISGPGNQVLEPGPKWDILYFILLQLKPSLRRVLNLKHF